jgi:hypothetical protein
MPENYGRYLGPVLFEPFADDLDAVIQAVTREISKCCGDTCIHNTLQAFVWHAVRN